MSEIDPEKLERAIAQACNHGPMQGGLAGGTFTSTPTHVLYTLIDAARAHLSTLPRWKEVEVVRWGVVNNSTGDLTAMFHADNEWMANKHCDQTPNSTVVRLTGTAKVKVKP